MDDAKWRGRFSLSLRGWGPSWWSRLIVAVFFNICSIFPLHVFCWLYLLPYNVCDCSISLLFGICISHVFSPSPSKNPKTLNFMRHYYITSYFSTHDHKVWWVVCVPSRNARPLIYCFFFLIHATLPAHQVFVRQGPHFFSIICPPGDVNFPLLVNN